MTTRSPERAPFENEDDETDPSPALNSSGAEEEAPEPSRPNPAAPEPEPPADEEDDPARAKLEARARRMGWVPKAEFRGNQDSWVDAEDFIERAYTNNRVLQERYERLEKQNEDLQAKVTDAGKVLGALNERFLNADRIGYERAKREIEERRRTAVENADTEAFDAAEKELRELAPPAEPEPERETSSAPQTPTVDPVAKQWAEENDWFKDDELGDVAITIHKRLLKKEPGLSLRENLDKVSAEVMRRYPERFENQRRNAASSVRSPSGDRSSGRGNGHTYENLPDDAKKACDMFVRTMPKVRDSKTGKMRPYAREDYCAAFEWDR